MRNANSWVPPQIYRVRFSVGGASIFMTPSLWFWCTLKFEITSVLEVSGPRWSLKHVHKGKWLNGPKSGMLIYTLQAYLQITKQNKTKQNQIGTKALLMLCFKLESTLKKKKDLYQIKGNQICLATCMIPNLYITWLGQDSVEDSSGIGRHRRVSTFSKE